MISVQIADGSTKNIDVGYKLIFGPSYLPPGNCNEQLVVSLTTVAQISIMIEGGSSPVVVDAQSNQILEVWVKE